MSNSDSGVGRAYIEEARKTLARCLRKINHCLDQLGEEDLHWRAFESHNSMQNVLLHLCGNVRQWIVSGVGGAPDVRNRPQEFADRSPVPKEQLKAQINDVVREADQVIEKLDPARLLERRRIQGFDETILSAIFHSVSHFEGHTHQIIYVTRLRVGERYVFDFVPKTPEQISAR